MKERNWWLNVRAEAVATLIPPDDTQLSGIEDSWRLEEHVAEDKLLGGITNNDLANLARCYRGLTKSAFVGIVKRVARPPMWLW